MNELSYCLTYGCLKSSYAPLLSTFLINAPCLSVCFFLKSKRILALASLFHDVLVTLPNVRMFKGLETESRILLENRNRGVTNKICWPMNRSGLPAVPVRPRKQAYQKCHKQGAYPSYANLKLYAF